MFGDYFEAILVQQSRPEPAEQIPQSLLMLPA